MTEAAFERGFVAGWEAAMRTMTGLEDFPDVEKEPVEAAQIVALAEASRLREALREIAGLDAPNCNWAPGMAMRSLMGYRTLRGSLSDDVKAT